MELNEVPGKQLESAINFNARHKSGSLPEDYLAQFLKISRL